MAKTQSYTQDQIAELLKDKRRQAAYKYAETYFDIKVDPVTNVGKVSGQIGIGDNLYEFSEIDKDGYVVLKNAKTGKTITQDPITSMYADGGAKLQSDIQGLSSGAQQAAGGGFKIQDLLGLSSVLGPAVQLFGLKGNKKDTPPPTITSASFKDNLRAFTDPSRNYDPMDADKFLKQFPDLAQHAGRKMQVTESINKINGLYQPLEKPRADLEARRLQYDNASLPVQKDLLTLEGYRIQYQQPRADQVAKKEILDNKIERYEFKRQELETKIRTARDAEFSPDFDFHETETQISKINADIATARKELEPIINKIESLDQRYKSQEADMTTLRETTQQKQIDLETERLAISREELELKLKSAEAQKEAKAHQEELERQTKWAERQKLERDELKQFNSEYRNAKIKLGGEAVGGATAGYYLFDTVFDLTRNGATFKGIAGAAGSFLGLLVSLKMMHSTLESWIGENLTTLKPEQFIQKIKEWPIFGDFLAKTLDFVSSNTGMGVVAGGIVAAAIIKGLLKKDPELAALEDLNEDTKTYIWNNGPVALLTSGVALASMGIGMGPIAPMYQSVSVPQIQLTKSLEAASGMTLTDANRYSTVFVQQGEGNEPTRMLWVNRIGTDKKGNPIEQVEVFTFDGPVKVTNPGNNPYIPALITDASGKRIPNPAYTKAIQNSGNLAKGGGALGGKNGQKPVLVGSSQSHQ